MSSPRNKPAALGSLLASSREAAARYAGTAIDREQWRRIVGERIALRTEPGAKRGRELTVNVASSSWAQELSLLVNEIVARIRAAGFGVDTVRFRVKEVSAPPRESAARKPPHRKAPLPSALDAQLANIEDAELREAIGEAAALWLALDNEASAKSEGRQSPTLRPGGRPAPLPATSGWQGARSLRGAESRSARSDQTTSPAPATSKDKPGAR